MSNVARTAGEDIAALILRYAEHIDAGDFAGLAALFEHAALRTDGHADVRRGRDEVRTLYESMVRLYDGRPSTQHVTTNIQVEVAPDGQSAQARSVYTVFQARPDLPLQPIVGGRYHDSFARGPGGWYFTERVIFVDLVGDLSRHLRRPI